MKGVVLVVVLALAVAAPAFAAGGSKEPTKRHTAADMRLAKSIALRRADLPAGWTQEKGTGGSSGGPDCPAYPDESKLIETGSVDPSFDSPGGGSVTVDSEVDVYATKAMALVDWRNGNIGVLRKCFADLLTKTTGKHVVVTATLEQVPVHAERSLAFRFEATWNGVAFDIDLIAVGKGRTTVLLSAAGPKGAYTRSLLTPFAQLLERRLSSSAS